MIVFHQIKKPKYRRGGTLLMQKPKYRYGGYGIWSTGKNVIRDNVKNLINSVSKKKIAQKVGDALISGATTSLVKKVDKSLNKVIKSKEKPFKVTQSILDKLPTVSGTGIVRD